MINLSYDFNSNKRILSVFMSYKDKVKHASCKLRESKLNEDEMCELVLNVVNPLLGEFFEEDCKNELTNTSFKPIDEESAKTLNRLCEELTSSMLSESSK